MVFEKSLIAMVKGIRANRGKESEYINTCIQEIQKETTSTNLQTKSTAILKLAYLTMMGYDMSWASFSVVEVMSHTKFAIRRPGYLAASMTFNENTDVGLLTINLFKKDFGSKSQYETGMAISCLSSICSPQMCRDLLTELSSMMSSSRAYLRKKTVLCLFRVFLRDPPALRTCFPKLKERLGDEDQGVLTATVNTFLELARKNARNYLSLVPQLHHLLVNTSNNWLSIKLLKLFQLLCPLEPRLPPKLEEPLMNILNTTKAASVEFEAIRTVLRVLPETSNLSALAVEKLQVFLNSSDRNLRYLGMELFQEAMQKESFRAQYQSKIQDLNSKVLLSIEETDPTARAVALQLLDLIVTPATLADSVKKLMEFAKKCLNPEEFHQTILRIGGRDCYALVEDFAWYLLVLADLAQTATFECAQEVANQFTDIIVRVPGVRPYAVQLALSLLDRDPTATTLTTTEAEDPRASTTAPTMNVAPAVIGACAWVVGEFYKDFEAEAEVCLPKAAQALLSAKSVHDLEPSVQTQSIWAGLKLYFGSQAVCPAVTGQLRELLLTTLPAFAKSTHVDVSDRATLAITLVKHMSPGASLIDCGGLFAPPLLPVASGAQRELQPPADLDLDEPFFVDEAPVPKYSEARVDPTDPYALAATYKDDLQFAAQEAPPVAAASASASQTSSMFYLGGNKDAAAEAEGSAEAGKAGAAAAASTDPLEAMRQKLAAARAGAAATRYEVLREDVRAPAAAATATSVTSAASARSALAPSASGSSALPTYSEKELAELHGRLWAPCFGDAALRVFAAVRSASSKKMQLRLELRCEKIAAATQALADVTIAFPGPAAPLEGASPEGRVQLVAGPLEGRSGKVRVSLNLAAFSLPTTCMLPVQVSYVLDGQPVSQSAELRLPSTMFLVPWQVNEDEIADYMGTRAAEHLTEQHATTVAIELSGQPVAQVAQDFPGVVSRCAGLCHMHAIQQQGAAQSKSQKFLMVARPLPPSSGVEKLAGQQELAPDARVVCLLAAMPKEGGVDVKATVKASHKDVCESVSHEIASIARELLAGRLRASA